MERVKKTLLLVKLGDIGRLPFLQELDTVVDNVVALLSDKEANSQTEWASDIISSRIFYQSDQVSFENTCANALAAVRKWKHDTGTPIDGVTSFSEFGIELCSYLVSELGLPGVPYSTTRCFRDKLVFRERCASAGIPVVRFAGLSTEEDVHAVLQDTTWKYPVVLKPRKGAGAWYVMKVDTAADLLPTWKRLNDRMMGEDKFPADIRNAGFLLEEYFDGKHEVDIDGWARKGSLEFSLVSDNNPAIEPNFLETGGSYPSQLPDGATRALTTMLKDIFKAFPGVTGCFHFEAKLGISSNDDGSAVYSCMPIEMNCRVGGAECPASFRACTGYQLAHVCAMLALDLPIPPPAKEGRHNVVCSTNLHPFKAGVVRTVSKDKVDMIANKVVTFVILTPMIGTRVDIDGRNGSSTCLGWISTGGQSFEEAKRNLEVTIAQTVVIIDEE